MQMIQRLSLKPAALLLTGELNSSKMLWLTLWATEGNLQALRALQSCHLSQLCLILVTVKKGLSAYICFFASLEPCMVAHCVWYAVVTSCVYTVTMWMCVCVCVCVCVRVPGMDTMSWMTPPSHCPCHIRQSWATLQCCSCMPPS